jgi:hypothetical protein
VVKPRHPRAVTFSDSVADAGETGESGRRIRKTEWRSPTYALRQIQVRKQSWSPWIPVVALVAGVAVALTVACLLVSVPCHRLTGWATLFFRQEAALTPPQSVIPLL